MGKGEPLMPTSVLVSQAAADTLCCLGLGLLLACLYDGGRLVAGNGKIAVFVLDTLFFGAAGIVACSYAAARSYAGVVRWYHLLGMLIGVMAYYKAFFGFTQWVRKKLLCILQIFLIPFVVLWWSCKNLYKKVAKACHQKRDSRKKKKNHSTLSTKQLQTTGKVLYNSK